jgi:uncharacterized delta-60 repeat protein
MLKIIALALIGGLATTALAQPNPDTLWTRSLGGGNSDYSNGLDVTFDGGVVLAGQTRSFGAGNWDFYLARYTDTGSLLWSRTYGGTRQDLAYDVQQTPDSGFIISGYSETKFVNGDAYLIKTNANGDTAWTRFWGASGGFERFYGVQVLADGYIACGTIAAGPSQLVLARYNLAGDTLWTKRYGGSSDEVGYDVQVDGDGGFIVAGYTASTGGSGANCFLLKTNSNGDSLWSRHYGGAQDEVANVLRVAADGGYFVAGRSHSFGQTTGDLYLIRTNASGDTLWTRTFGYSSAQIHGLVLHSDGGCILAGYGSAGSGQDYYVLRLSATGAVLWTRTYGGTAQDLCTDIEQAPDGGFYVSGYSQSFAGSHDFYLVKTGAEGSLGLLSPNGGEDHKILLPFTVSWFASPASVNVRIELNRDYPVGEWETLIASTPDDGVEAVSVGGLPSATCRIRVTQLPGGGSDLSDDDFSLSLSTGQIALISLPDLMTPIHSWSNDSLECGTIRALSTHIKNFGPDSCIVWAPLPFSTPDFTVISPCLDSAILAPGQYQSCLITLRYDPESDGYHYDTLRIQSNAANAVGNFYTVPVEGFRYSFPKRPDSLVAVAYVDSVRLQWAPVTVSTNECVLNPPITDYVLYTATHPGQVFTVLDTVNVNTYLVNAPLDTNRVYRVTAIDPTP